ncbi:MAG: hypothetical protein KA185_14275, partial [Vitreoscilla sp.]|nr:hypothetical protein [Vitreoscilla sp.]
EQAAALKLRQRERLQLGLLRVQAALTTGQPGPLDWPAEALATGDLALAAEWALWATLHEPPPWPPGHVVALLQRLTQAGLQLLAEPLQALATSAPLCPPPHATPPPLATSPWTALLWARQQLQQGQEQAARNTTARGLADLQWLAEHQVPPAFRESFLQRHPAHRALQALGARLRAGGLLSAGP